MSDKTVFDFDQTATFLDDWLASVAGKEFTTPELTQAIHTKVIEGAGTDRMRIAALSMLLATALQRIILP